MSIENKLTYLNETKNQIKTSLGSKSEVFRDYVEDINYLNQVKNQALANQKISETSGEYINVTDSGEMPCVLSIDTNIKQDSREGYNLLNLENKTIEQYGSKAVIENGKITINGTPENNMFNMTFIEYKAIKSGTFTLKPFKSSTTKDIRLIYQKNTGNWLNSDDNPQIAMVEGDILTINLRMTTTNVISNFTMTPMLYLGTDDKPYEQFGSMPSIEFSSEIKTPVGKQSFYAGNKNLFDKDNLELLVVNNSGAERYGNKFTKAGTYTISQNGKLGGQFYIKTIDVTGNYVNIGYPQNSLTRVISEGETLLVCMEDGMIGVDGEIQVEYDSTATAYTPHQSQVQDLDLNEELLGTIVDKEDGSYFENRYKIVDAKDLNWYTVDNSSKSDTILRFNSTNDDALTIMDSPTSPITLYSNLFKCEYIINAYTKECIAPHNGIANHINMFIDKSKLVTEDIEGLKAFLEENNCKILYPLLKPTYTKLTDEQQEQWNKIKKMHTYEGVTNIYTINENGISPVINLEYNMSINALTDKITELGGTV